MRKNETEHENVLSVMYFMNSPKDIKSSYFRKVTPVNWSNLFVVDGGRCHDEIVFCVNREKELSGHLKIQTKHI